jgi:hypothetical protein
MASPSTNETGRFPKDPALLRLNYDNGKERQAAAFARNTNPLEGDTREWFYHSRGLASEVIEALRGPVPGYIGGIGGMDPEDVRVVIDQPSWGTDDRSDLCWGGPPMTVAEFQDWYKKATQ